MMDDVFAPLELIWGEGWFPITPVSIAVALAGAFVVIFITTATFSVGFALVKKLMIRLEVSIFGETAEMREERINMQYDSLATYFEDTYGKKALRQAGIDREAVEAFYRAGDDDPVGIDEQDVIRHYEHTLATRRAEEREVRERRTNALRQLDRAFTHE